MKVAMVAFGGGISTMGLSVVSTAIEAAQIPNVEIVRCRPTDAMEIKSADVIMVSLYWFENVLDWMLLLRDLGIDPRKKKPLLVVGGVVAINVRILHGYFHYSILGDGELVAADVVRAIVDGSDPASLPGVITAGDLETQKELLTNPIIPAAAYVEQRGNNTARIEIARGCRFKCPFCQLGHLKPYREQPLAIVEHLLAKCGTKSVGLFAPDRTGYTDYDQLEIRCRQLGKHNTAEDARLDQIMKRTVVNKVKFGVEGFSEKTRRRFHKIPTNQMLIDGMDHVFNVLKTPKGKPITTATVYMIGDLPGEGAEQVQEFWDTLAEVDKRCKARFTLFLTLNSFSAKPFTPMERAGIHPYNDWNAMWRARPRLNKITVAERGGMLGPANRIIHAAIMRGDERLTRAIFYIATDGRKIFKDPSEAAGQAVEKLFRMCGVEPESIWGELSGSHKMPHQQFTIQPLPDLA